MGFTQNGQNESIENNQSEHSQVEHPYVYVLVRRDLSESQRSVQSCHAIIEACRAFDKPPQIHPSVIICGIRNEDRLQRAMAKLEAAGIQYRAFREPDRNNEITALATEPITGERRQFFSQFNLLGSEQPSTSQTNQNLTKEEK